MALTSLLVGGPGSLSELPIIPGGWGMDKSGGGWTKVVRTVPVHVSFTALHTDPPVRPPSESLRERGSHTTRSLHKRHEGSPTSVPSLFLSPLSVCLGFFINRCFRRTVSRPTPSSWRDVSGPVSALLWVQVYWDERKRGVGDIKS